MQDGDLISSNSIRFLLPIMRGQKINLFPEGASCFDLLLKKSLLNKIKVSLTIFVKKILIGHFDIIKKYIVPDIEKKFLII